MMFDQGELPVGVDQGIAVHRQVDSGSWLPIGAIDDVLDRAAMVSTATEVRALTANRHPAAAVVDGTRGPRRSAVAHSSQRAEEREDELFAEAKRAGSSSPRESRRKAQG